MAFDVAIKGWVRVGADNEGGTKAQASRKLPTGPFWLQAGDPSSQPQTEAFGFTDANQVNRARACRTPPPLSTALHPEPAVQAAPTCSHPTPSK